jgi:hypothetical protein
MAPLLLAQSAHAPRPLLLVLHLGYGSDPSFSQRYPNDEIATIADLPALTPE